MTKGASWAEETVNNETIKLENSVKYFNFVATFKKHFQLNLKACPIIVWKH